MDYDEEDMFQVAASGSRGKQANKGNKQMRRRLTPHTLQQLSKYIAHWFRNTALVEDLHAGTFPSSMTGDYSDVKVVSPYGEIPWNGLGRFDDEEMKALMITLIDHIFTVLSELANRDELLLDFLSTHVVHREWNEPQIDQNRQLFLDVAVGRKTFEEALEISKVMPKRADIPSVARKCAYWTARSEREVAEKEATKSSLSTESEREGHGSMKFPLEPGSAYVGKDYKVCMIRVILENNDDEIRYATYSTETGELISSHDTCSGRTLSAWIGREATGEEVARLQRRKRPAEEQNSFAESLKGHARTALSDPESISDEALLAEVKRRDLMKQHIELTADWSKFTKATAEAFLKLEEAFHQDICRIVELEKELRLRNPSYPRNSRYHSQHFSGALRASLNHGRGLEVARNLLSRIERRNVFTWLRENHRLDLTVENHVVQAKYWRLFSESERRNARERLASSS
jgi:hypothetical protein